MFWNWIAQEASKSILIYYNKFLRCFFIVTAENDYYGYNVNYWLRTTCVVWLLHNKQQSNDFVDFT
jgi:hypothetical protein